MTENEAIKSALKKVEAQQDNLGGFMDRFDIPEHWAVRNALEKQIPKKPEMEKYTKKELYFCPICGTEVTDCKYCPQCGQKIGGDEEHGRNEI